MPEEGRRRTDRGCRRGFAMVVIVGIVVCGCGRSAVDLSAEEILRLAESAYTSASTYRDQGVAELVVTTPDGEEGKVATTFTTVFRRPSDFRLTYRSSEGGWAHAILATDAGTESWVEGAEIPMPWDNMADAPCRSLRTRRRGGWAGTDGSRKDNGETGTGDWRRRSGGQFPRASMGPGWLASAAI